MENVKKNGFIAQTANDYNMDYSQVERIYDMWYTEGLFYEKLEDFIQTRSQLA